MKDVSIIAAEAQALIVAGRAEWVVWHTDSISIKVGVFGALPADNPIPKRTVPIVVSNIARRNHHTSSTCQTVASITRETETSLNIKGSTERISGNTHVLSEESVSGTLNTNSSSIPSSA